MLPSTLFVQEKNGVLFVNRTAEGAAGHSPGDNMVGEYVLKKSGRIVHTASVEEVSAAEQSALAPQT